MNPIKMHILNVRKKFLRCNYISSVNMLHMKNHFTTNSDNKNNEEKTGKYDGVKEKKPNGLQIDCEIKSPLKEFLNTDTASRVFVLKYAWKYIKDNNLQNPNMKRKIIPDEKLKQILDKDEVDMLEVPKLLFKHMASIRKD
ncbi:SWIB/MDM2 domain-containing protein, putative [Plasmodium ovale]|uniref:SWIB/MDM2 domain-containing protein, putative n=2 Tax=Plasmodium ovale TaxID=36330 RepID=A0A1D3U8N0_PLAOA|nr:SWIB/MDM2 domain-containing protein, putative [Plasmodium ovale]